ncbi:MAG: ABC transporter permease subunit [Coriobacteriia bacterium]|nr:ABC transporter permease subunit [Coriobacteriia bacterium]
MGVTDLLAAYGPNYLSALLTTWRLTIASFALVMVLSIVVTVMRVCPFKPLRLLGDLYVQVFRNVPGAVLILIVVYALPYLKIVLDYEPSVVLVTVLLGASFGSENFMTGINTIGVGQIEAARSIGLSFGQILRKIVIPQALRSTVLPMTNLLIAVMLTTALGSQVPMSTPELTGIVSYINTRESAGVATFFISACGYIATALVIGFAGNKLDQKVRIAR